MRHRQELSLYDLCVTMLDTYVNSGQLPNGDHLAQLAKRMISAEIAPGGPYRGDDTHTMFITNVVIGQLFQSLGTPLPLVDAYIHRQISVGALDHLGQPAVAILSSPYNYLSGTHSTRPQHTIAVSPSSTANIVADEIAALPAPIANIARTTWQRIVKADARREISDITKAFITSLPPSALSPSKSLTAQLSKANFYVWMAYTLYDDCLDTSGTSTVIPAANILHRTAYQSYRQAAHTPADLRIVDDYFNRMDAANAWEIQHCRLTVDGTTIHITALPHYQQRRLLFERAGAHVLGPILAAHSQPTYTLAQRRLLQAGCAHYVIARQLNDDAHDWQDDLARGQVSPVVAHLLRHTRVPNGPHNLSDLTRQLQTYFWQHGQQQICDMIQTHIHRARRAFRQSRLVTEDSPFLHITIDPIDMSVQAAAQRQHDQHAFLETYRRN